MGWFKRDILAMQPMLNPLLIDNLLFSKQLKQLQGELHIEQLARLATLLDGQLSLGQQVNYYLRGYMDARHQHWLQMRVQANLQVICQRCLEPMSLRLEGDFSYLISDAKDDSTDYDYEQPNVAMDVTALIEDELLMLFPIAPCHTTCWAFKTEAGASPFTVLKRD